MASDGDGLSPDEAFQLLGDELRTAILRAVWESPEDAVSFTAIRERAGSPDSGKFNYHLNKLSGHFLLKSEDGYRLTQAGREVVRAVMAGVITQRPDRDPVPIDARCAECRGELHVGYEEYGRIECGACGRTIMWNEFPPAGLADRSPQAVADALDRWTRARFGLAMEGICPNCASEVTTEILDHDTGSVEDGDDDGDADSDLTILHRCEHCKYEARVPLFGHVMTHPAVVSFYDEAGVDVTSMPYWELQSTVREATEEVIGTDPWRARIALSSKGRECEVTLDEHLDIVDIERSDR